MNSLGASPTSYPEGNAVKFDLDNLLMLSFWLVVPPGWGYIIYVIWSTR